MPAVRFWPLTVKDVAVEAEPYVVMTAEGVPEAERVGVELDATPIKTTSSKRNCTADEVCRKRIRRLAVDGIDPVGATFNHVEVPVPVGRV